jgi:hypothetical protein
MEGPAFRPVHEEVLANTLRRDPYWFDRILEEITYKFDPEDPRRPAGARIVAVGHDMWVHVVIPDTLVRLHARQRHPAWYDRTTTVINVVEALAVDDLNELRPDHSDEIDHELANLELPPIDGWRTHAPWPATNVAAASDETRDLLAAALDHVDSAADGLDYGTNRAAIDGAVTDALRGVLQAPAAYVRADCGLLLVPARLVFSAEYLVLPASGWQSNDRGAMADAQRRRRRPVHRHYQPNLGHRLRKLNTTSSPSATGTARRHTCRSVAASRSRRAAFCAVVLEGVGAARTIVGVA